MHAAAKAVLLAATAATTTLATTSSTTLATAASPPLKFVSVLGDPRMSQPEPRILLESWNFCNRCGRACDVGPRWADCVSEAGEQLVSEAANAAGLPRAAQGQPTCDAFAEQKERDLGELCQRRDAERNATSFMWSFMLKSGAWNDTEKGALCGLWCEKEGCSGWSPGTRGPALDWNDTNYNMRQATVAHVPSAPDGAGGWSGAFYGTWDPRGLKTPGVVPPDVRVPQILAPQPTPPPAVSSYFGVEWFVRAGRRIFRHSLVSGDDCPWLMLYSGPEAASGPKGGYPWDGRGIMSVVPRTTLHNASTFPPSAGKRPTNSWRLHMWANYSQMRNAGTYFLNMGACWKDDGRECDGDLSTDVTRYVMFQFHNGSVGTAAEKARAERCGPHASQLHLCPPSHTYRNGSSVRRGEPHFPYEAYHSVSTRRPRAKGEQYHCKHDCWSNPQEQDWVRIEPSAAWGELGFPSSVEDGLTPNYWQLEVGAFATQVAGLFSGAPPPPVIRWHTLNSGPELNNARNGSLVWETSQIDVLLEEGDDVP